MPLYEYRCSKCDKTFEVIQKFSDSPLTEHENCGGPVERLLSAPAFQLKGTGWYVTDYAKGSSKAPDSSTEPKPAASDSKAPDSTAPDSKSSDAKSTGSKPETKASEAKKSDAKTPAAKNPD